MAYHSQHHMPPPGRMTEKSEVETKQATDKPHDMLMVVIVGTLAAAIVLWMIWAMVYAPG